MASRTESECLSEEAIADLASGSPDAAKLASYEPHLSRCRQCREFLAAAARGVQALDQSTDLAAGLPARAFSPTSSVEPGEAGVSRASSGWANLSKRRALERFECGAVIGARFRVQRFIARGGMAEVYEAEDQVLRTTVALKIMAFEGQASSETFARFRREVSLARSVTHPNVCRVFDVGFHEDARLGFELAFMTMELLSGETLSARIRRAGPYPADLTAMAIVSDICAGVSAAHANGIIHRDLKCGNVILAEGSPGRMRAVVTDFGLARLHEGELTLTREGQVLGTPATMAPEQVLGESVTSATDIYALGCILFEMLTGTPPFVGDTAFASLNLRLTQRAPSLRERIPEIPIGWERTVARCLERQPAKRFQTAEEVVVALGTQTSGLGIWGHSRWLAALGATAVVAVVAVLLGGQEQVWNGLRGAARGLPSSQAPSASALREAERQVMAGALRAEPQVLTVLPLTNLSRSLESDWLATALREMLATELGTSARLQLVPGDSVARAVRDLSKEADGTSSEAALERVATMTAADVVLGGTYAVVKQGDVEKIRIDVSIFNAARRPPLTKVASAGTPGELFDLVAQLGTQLRDGLGVPPPDPALAQATRAATLQDPAAARAYAEGIAFERGFDLAAASERFLAVIERAPDYALGHSELANVYRLMGQDDLARKEAARALASSQDLSRELQLLVEARAHAASQEWSSASQAYETLFRFYPSNVYYGMQLARAVLNDGYPEKAFDVIAQLRKLPSPISSNPEIDVLEALTATKGSDYARCLRVARIALEKGQAAGSKSLTAEAKSLVAEAEYHVGDRQSALELRLASLELYRELGDQRGTARALDALGDLYFDTGDFAATLRSKAAALTIARAIGHQYRVGGLLNSIGEVEQMTGSLSAARSSYEQARDTYRGMNEREGVANVTANLASLRFEEGALSEARALFEKALAMHVALGARIGEAYDQIAIGRLAHAAGDLREARERCERGRAIVEALQDRARVSEAQLAISAIHRDKGDFEPARAAAEAALDTNRQLGDRQGVAEAELQLARLALDAGETISAVQYTDAITSEPRSSPTHRALAFALRGRAFAISKQATEAEVAAKLAASMIASMQGFLSKAEIELAVADEQARLGAQPAAGSAARDILVRAEASGHVGLTLEARLLLARLTPKDTAGRRELFTMARDKHYGRIARMVRALPDDPWRR